MVNRKTIETKEIVDFGLFYAAKQYYEAAKMLKCNQFVSNPYFILLSFSIELFLKSIGTTIHWSGARASRVEHIEGHNLSQVFESMENENPDSAKYLKEKYSRRFKRNLAEDIRLNSEVFVKRRYPYFKGGRIPSMSAGIFNLPEMEKDICVTVYITQLENVAELLHDELIVHFGGLFDDI